MEGGRGVEQWTMDMNVNEIPRALSLDEGSNVLPQPSWREQIGSLDGHRVGKPCVHYYLAKSPQFSPVGRLQRGCWQRASTVAAPVEHPPTKQTHYSDQKVRRRSSLSSRTTFPWLVCSRCVQADRTPCLCPKPNATRGPTRWQAPP